MKIKKCKVCGKPTTDERTPWCLEHRREYHRNYKKNCIKNDKSAEKKVIENQLRGIPAIHKDSLFRGCTEEQIRAMESGNVEMLMRCK